MVNKPSVNDVFLETSIHEMEVDVLVAGGAGVNDAALRLLIESLLFRSQFYRGSLSFWTWCRSSVFIGVWCNVGDHL